MDNIQSLVMNYIQSYLSNTENVNIRNSATIGTRMPGHDIGENSFTAGINNAAEAPHSIALGSNNEADYKANSAVVFGEGNRAYSQYQLVHGKYNDSDSNDIYAHIVGGGEPDAPKNIYTLDWEGNAWFGGNINIGEDGQEIATKEYFNQNIAIKFFPYYEIDETTVKIYANELEPYTIYKVKMNDKYNRIQFYVRTEFGDIPFLYSDSTMNKYNMFVSNKTEDEMTFIVNSVLYKINLKTGRVEKSIDGTFAGPGMGDDTDIEYAKIDDEIVDPNYTWSSQKISQELEKDFNEARIENGHLILGHNGNDIADLELPITSGSSNISEEDMMRWNNKLDNPIGGNTGQVLTLDSNNTPIWADPVGGEGGIANSADQVSYYNGDITTVQEALDKLLYNAPTITSFTSDRSSAIREKGDVVNSPITFTWNYTNSAPIQSITLSYIDSILPTAKSATYSVQDITENTNFILTITDTKDGTASKTIGYTFGLAKYYGAATKPATYNSEFIDSLSGKHIDTKRTGTYTVNAGTDQYIYFCIPTEWGTPTFSSGGFDGGFREVTELNHSNIYGISRSYTIWESDNHSLGNTTITIK